MVCFSCLVAKLCLTLLQPHRLQPTRLLYPQHFPDNNTEVDFLLSFPSFLPSISFYRGSSRFRVGTCVSCITDRFFATEPPREALLNQQVLVNQDENFFHINEYCTSFCYSSKHFKLTFFQLRQNLAFQLYVLKVQGFQLYVLKGLLAQSCPTLYNPMDCCSLPDSSVHGILQARIVKWVAISFSRGSY